MFAKSIRWRIQVWHGFLLVLLVAGMLTAFYSFERSERQPRAKAQNRCAIARCAGSPTASAVIGGEIVNSGRGALS